MTGGRCQRRKKMMGRGAKGGCGTEERPCPISRAPATTPATQTENSENYTSLEIDYYSQATKALSERSPFDEETSASIVPTLPSGLASLLNRHSDSRRRHKKSHSSADKKSSRLGEKSRNSNIWVETEDYFRDLTLPDVGNLFEVSNFSGLTTRKCYSIPILGNAPRSNVGIPENGIATDAIVNEVSFEDGDCLMEIDSVRADVLPQEDKLFTISDFSSCLEWLLGYRNKISLTSERPSKKRKLLGADAGLEKIIIAVPSEGDSTSCHYCCLGDTGKEFNQLIVCNSCKASVHQKCYGVHDNVDMSWLCSWCKQKDDVGDSVRPCVLCPKKGGALKLVHKSVENGGPLEFAHLFCCLWMPEVYIEDLRKMEPIMNVEGIKETRKKLVCNICKVKFGACVRCSHGTCRASFHPICAREARHRMEVWAKYGFDNVELRAFCSKHSEVQDYSGTPQAGNPSVSVGSELSVANPLPLTKPVSKPHKSRIGHRNGHNNGVHVSPYDNCSDKSGDDELQEVGSSDSRLSARVILDCGGTEQLNDTEFLGSNKDVNPYDSLNFALILKKLIDRGKVDMKNVALDIGISPDLLSANLAGDRLVPDVQCKIVDWFKAHAYISTLQKDLKVKIKPVNSCKDEAGAADGSDTLPISDSDNLDPVAVKSVPPRRRTVSNVRILRDSKVICSSGNVFSEIGIPVEKVKIDQPPHEAPEDLSRPPFDPSEMNSTESDILPRSEGNLDKRSDLSFSETVPREEADVSLQNACVNADQQYPVCPASKPADSALIKTEAVTSYYIHPDIKKKFLQIQSRAFSQDFIGYLSDSREEGASCFEKCSKASVSCSNETQYSNCNDVIPNSDQVNMEQLVMAKKMGVLESSPEDEVEGEIIYFQHRLLCNAFSRKQFSDNLICTVAKSLPEEIDAAWHQRWDAVLVNQYLYDLIEAKKLGRKERRHKEAQAVLAAATAAAAASSRVSSFRKDSLDESAQPENFPKFDTFSGRSGICSQPMPRAKETLSRLAVTRTSSEKHSDFAQSASAFSKEHPRSCDICRRSETILNPILVCSNCKFTWIVTVTVKEPMGPWYCELCEDLSRISGAPPVNFWEKPYFVAECSLCGGTTGAFRKCSDGQWVHAFCAEWVFQSTFRRGQSSPIEGMETLLKGADVCYLCSHKQGVCIKCNYGHCQTSYHPFCARNAGLYMNVRLIGGKLQHKAYCEKHSLEQRAKAETHKHGIEELKRIKQIRVELERLRLLCERIIKREKIKRELVLCSHDILAFKRDHAARSVLVHSPLLLPDGSSESATTSLKGHTDDYKSSSEAVQRSDDVTVDSSVSSKHRVRVTISMDTDQRIDDDCSTSHSHFNRKLSERVQYSGKQIPQRPSVVSRNLLDDVGWRSKSRKHAETFEKELVMTSDQASMKNMMLPKGYAYVPADCLSNDKHSNQDACGSEPLEHEG
ncbi:putative Phd finger protein [Quillaja saponaria]|uniref:Phd finger protein n=1 Tax=Quillaja saponaria TaxID=32244 RepID=A0AAD7LWJ7_QUISA|nr:putative Phd finger protein [Quillaja saponaria]